VITKNKKILDLLKKKNVNGFGYGKQMIGGKEAGIGLVVTVTKKEPQRKLKKADIVPSKIDNIATDVIEIGEIKALLPRGIPAKKANEVRSLEVDRTSRQRPFSMGMSIAHRDVTAGTAGCLVKRIGDDKDIFVLSNNHVLANMNDAEIGDLIVQPGPHDGGLTSQDVVGHLTQFIPIKYNTCQTSNLTTKMLNRISKIMRSSAEFTYILNRAKAESVNFVDCAIAKLDVPNIAKKTLLGIGDITKWGGPVQVSDTLKKTGRTTEVTEMKVDILDWTGQVAYGANMAIFSDQYLCSSTGTGPASQGGDSGSAVVKVSGREIDLVGLLFAGSDQFTIVSKIKYALEGLKVQPVF
jgi:hypothetical protein